MYMTGNEGPPYCQTHSRHDFLHENPTMLDTKPKPYPEPCAGQHQVQEPVHPPHHHHHHHKHHHHHPTTNQWNSPAIPIIEGQTTRLKDPSPAVCSEALRPEFRYSNSAVFALRPACPDTSTHAAFMTPHTLLDTGLSPVLNPALHNTQPRSQ